MDITIVSFWAQKLFRSEEPQPFGGAELQLVLLARALAEMPDVTVRFITRGQGPAESFRNGNIHVHKLPYRRHRLTRSILGLWDSFRACLRLPTDVFLQRGGGWETGMTAFAAQIARKPFFFMTSSTWDVDGTHEKQRGYLFGKTYMYGLRRSTAIVTQTQNQHDLLLNRYGRENTILRSAHPIPESIPENKSGVLWVGRCEPCKNPDLFIELAKQIPDVPCTMVCPPANLIGMYDLIRGKAETAPNLRFLPGVSFAETESLFASHKIMVNTSTQEGYPNTYVQAFKWGVPIITALFDPDGILETRKMGQRVGENPQDIAKAVIRILDDWQVWQEYSANAREFARQHHDIETVASRLYELLRKTIATYPHYPASS